MHFVIVKRLNTAYEVRSILYGKDLVSMKRRLLVEQNCGMDDLQIGK